jgi:bifunctional DNA-binding transcriptional regulator/antitoxin component of YhaV-PrlF toxin-antitoxin module
MESNRMTAVVSQQGQISLPKEAFEAGRLTAGERFDVKVSEAGDILLRRIRRRKKSLTEHLRGLEGLEIIRNREPIPPQ